MVNQQNKTVLELKNISKSYKQGSDNIEILKNIDISINQGQTVGLLGQSGSGKSTLLQIAGLLDKCDEGEVLINQISTAKSNDKTRTKLRRDNIGFIYQFHHLLPEFSAVENIAIPQMIKGVDKKESSLQAMELLEKLGIEKRAKHRPAELSGGEQQRVAIARALINKPSLILADEPTGNLDPQTSAQVFDLLVSSVKEFGLAIMIVTHNHQLAAKLDKVVTIESAKIKQDS